MTAQSAGLVERLRTLAQAMYGDGDEWNAYDLLHDAADALAAAPAADGWRPIETAPEGEVVLVGWRDERDDFAEHHTMDVLDEGVWHDHEEHVQWAEAVAPPGSVLPPQTAPYRWWRAIPPLPAAPQAQGEGNGDA